LLGVVVSAKGSHDNIRRCAAAGTRSGPLVAVADQSNLSRSAAEKDE